MPIPWDKVIPQRPHVIEAARGWYEKWIRGERSDAKGANHGERTPLRPEEAEIKVEAYAEPIKFEDVVEVKEAAKDVAGRLEALEFAGMAQAETLKNLTEQNQGLAHRLSELQQALKVANESLEEGRTDTAAHKASLENLEMRILHLSTDLSRVANRIKIASWIGGIGLAGAIVAILIAVMR